jgi:DNA invertase Pin-like site-specific DNA recombinase
VSQLTKAGCKEVFREVASGAKTYRAQLRRLHDQLDTGGVLIVPASTAWRDPPATC